MPLSSLFYYVATLSSISFLILAVVFGFINRKQLKFGYQWFLIYLTFTLVIEVVSNLLIQIENQNLILYPVYAGGEFFCLSMMYFRLLRLSGIYSIVSISGSFFISLELIIQWNNNTDYTSIGVFLSNIFIIIIAAYYLINTVYFSHVNRKNPMLSINICLFLYFSVSFLLSLLLEQIIFSPIQQASVIWGINNVLSTILYGIAFITFKKLK